MQRISELPDYQIFQIIQIYQQWPQCFDVIFCYCSPIWAAQLVTVFSDIFFSCAVSGHQSPCICFLESHQFLFGDVARSGIFTASAVDNREKPEQITGPQHFRREPRA